MRTFDWKPPPAATHALASKPAPRAGELYQFATVYTPGTKEDARISSRQAMEPAVSNLMEPRFGHDFSHVLVHDMTQATRAAAAVKALQPIAYPHRERVLAGLEQRLEFRSVLDPKGCSERRTPAFTVDDTTHFESASPGLHVAAHEAAHQLQHRGVTYDLGLGPEGHANLIADAVVQGRAHAGLVSRRGEPVSQAERRYSLAKKDGETFWRAIRQEMSTGDARLSDSGESLTLSTQEAYAKPELITDADGVLRLKGSNVRLSVGDDAIQADAPNGTGVKTLRRVVAQVRNPTQVCEQMAFRVMGSGGTETPSAVARLGGVPTEIAPTAWKNSPVDPWVGLLLLNQQIKSTPDYALLSDTDKKKLHQEAFKKKKEGDDLWAQARALEKQQASAGNLSSAALGIDEYAIPEIGEAFAAFRTRPAGENEYPHHYAAVIMAVGSDRVTLENEAQRKPGDWQIRTYGTAKPSQTFHQEHGTFADDPAHPHHTLRMRNQPPHPSYGGSIPKMNTSELLRRYRSAGSDENAKHYLRRELKNRHFVIWVRVHKSNSSVLMDRIVIEFVGHTTSVLSKHVAEGEGHMFFMPVLDVLHLVDPLVVNVREGAVLPELIGSLSWSDPYDKNGPHPMHHGRAYYEVYLDS